MEAMVVNIPHSRLFHIVSLGCPKNLTDSEALMGQMAEEGFSYTSDPASAEVIIINTCAFLSSARKESLDVIKEMAAYKKNGACRQLLVAGCLPKYKVKSKKLEVRKGRGAGTGEIQHVDGIIDSIGLHDCHVPRVKATPPWTAYIKMSEGCNNNCAYCLIPSIRGKLRYRTVGDIIKQVDAAHGQHLPQHRNFPPAKEIIFVAQDTTAHPKFPEILKKTAKIKGVRWIRVMYTHPKHITDKFIDVMAKERKVLKYIDLPMQHSSDKMLKAMNRGYDRKYLEALIAKLRKKMPSVAIRTTFIVGFPGETEKDFENLTDFVKTIKFDRVGAFPFSREKGTKAYGMKGQVGEKVKSERVRKLMKIQEKISRQKNRGFIGKTMEVLIEGAGLKPARTGSACKFTGRTYRDAPEIDGRVEVVSSKEQGVRVGDIVKVKITKAGTHDLEGTVI